MIDERLEHGFRIETRVVEDEDRRLRIPRREETAPRVLGPPRRADVPVAITGLKASTFRIAAVRCDLS